MRTSAAPTANRARPLRHALLPPRHSSQDIGLERNPIDLADDVTIILDDSLFELIVSTTSNTTVPPLTAMSDASSATPFASRALSASSQVLFTDGPDQGSPWGIMEHLFIKQSAKLTC